MKVLFVSQSPVRREISSGNTFLNIFEGIDNIELASVYTRVGLPDSKISKAFCITEKDIIRSFFKGPPVGKVVTSLNASKDVNEKKILFKCDIMSLIKKMRPTVAFWLQNLIWKTGRWKKSELDEFVKEYNPDIVFAAFSDSYFLNNLILYIKEISNAKLVMYSWDNNYTLKIVILSPLKWINHLINRKCMRKVARHIDLFYSISETQKTDYEADFKREIKILTKGASFDIKPTFDISQNKPLKLVYTGNIGLNRWKTLAMIASALENINKNGIKAQMEIYTANEITDRIFKALNIEGVSRLMGSVSGDKVCEIQKNADILIHVESADLKNRLIVRTSFSTKLVDYFHQAKCIFAVGNSKVNSIYYLKENDAAVVATNNEEVKERLKWIIDNPDLIREYGDKAWECGKRNHQIDKIQEMLMNDLRGIVQENV